ncbi:MAG TPA: hypothetical protein VHG51_10850 [Longimicrobiaceae bacterium]|nr:hypothetical protein [Longimicrobiaceae bacterium]
MSDLAWFAAGAMAGVGAMLLLARRGLLPLGRGRRRTEPGAADRVRVVSLAPEDLKLIRSDIRGLDVVRADLQRVGDLLERLLEVTVELHQARVDAPRPEPAGRPARGGVREPVRNPSPGPAPLSGATWRRGGSDPGPLVRHDERDGGFDPNLDAPAPAWVDPASPAPSAAHLAAPSADALNVEAKDDAVVPSPRHPAEAWLERRGGSGEVWLNPQVPLTDPALQRWSTFFEWERREPGARYQATRPAVVSWSGTAGTVVRKGLARPV